jgi:hypothetical protein
MINGTHSATYRGLAGLAGGICVDRTLQTPQQILPSNACFGSQPRCTQRILSGESLGELLSKG